MDSSDDSSCDARIEEIERLMQVFKEKFKEGTSSADNFLTISEIEQLWGELQDKTNNNYLHPQLGRLISQAPHTTSIAR